MSELPSSILIGNRRVGPGAPCYLIAEAGSNHNRDLDLALKLIDAAAEAGADAVKFQTFSAEAIASQADIPLTRIDFAGARSPYELFKGLELPRQWQQRLCDYAAAKGITFLSTPFDEVAVDELDVIGVAALKVASFELNHFPMLRRIAATGRPVLLSTGMATLGEVEEALGVLRDAGCREVALFHCGIAYPMDPKHVNLRAMDSMAAAFTCPVGYSDHTMGIAVPVAAVARGAALIEKHFTLSRGLPGPDHPFALEPHELKEMVQSVRTVEAALGSKVKGPAPCEMEFKARGRRSVFAAVDIPAGTPIRRPMLAVLRPSAGLHPRYIEVIEGRPAARDIRCHDPITWDCLLGEPG